MARRKLTDEQRAAFIEQVTIQPRAESPRRPGLSLLDFGETSKAKAPTKKRKPRKMRLDELEQGVAAVTTFVRPRRYEDLEPKQLVYLYAWCHKNVYGVLPLELLRELGMACMAAKRMLEQHFGGETKRMVHYITWVWARESAAFAKREGDFRIGWKYQFVSDRMLTDYRIALAKKGRIQ